MIWIRAGFRTPLNRNFTNYRRRRDNEHATRPGPGPIRSSVAGGLMSRLPSSKLIHFSAPDGDRPSSVSLSEGSADSRVELAKGKVCLFACPTCLRNRGVPGYI